MGAWARGVHRGAGMTLRKLSPAFVTALLAACTAPTTSASPCEEAAAHVAACLGTEATTPATCDEAAAERALGSSCDAIAAAGGKGDGWWCLWNPFGPGCGASDDPEEPTGPEAHRLTGYVGFTWGIGAEPSPIGCARVLLEGEDGVHATFTTSVGAFAFEDLAPGTYELRVVNREDEVALDRLGEPAVRTLTIEGDGHEAMVLSLLADGTNNEFGTGLRSEDAVSRCGNVRFDLTLTDSCGEAVTPYLESRFDWILSLEGEDGVDHAAAYCQPVHGDHWSWDGCGGDADDITRATFGSVSPGTYAVRAYRVDLPERNNLDYEDELRWRDSDVFDLGEIEVEGDGTWEVTLADPRAGGC